MKRIVNYKFKLGERVYTEIPKQGAGQLNGYCTSKITAEFATEYFETLLFLRSGNLNIGWFFLRAQIQC